MSSGTRLQRVADGAVGEYIPSLLRGQRIGHSLFIRFGWDMDGARFP